MRVADCVRYLQTPGTDSCRVSLVSFAGSERLKGNVIFSNKVGVAFRGVKGGSEVLKKGSRIGNKFRRIGGVKGELASFASDLRRITAGQRPFVPRAGLEPAAKRVSPSEYQGVPLTLKNIEF